MATFAEKKAEQSKPQDIVLLEPSAFRTKPPKAKVAIGLRLLSQQEVMTAQAESWKEARQGEREGEAMIERFNEALLCWVVATAACDPNNAAKPYFEFADIEVRERLTTDAIRHLWDRFEMAQAAASPLTPPVSDEELANLGVLLCGDAPLAQLNPAHELRVRRWARVMFDLLVG